MKRFLVVGTQRTGSSVLADMMGLHPHIVCGWEWTQNVARHKKLWIAEKALRGDFSLLSPEDKAHMQRTFHPGTAWLGFRRLFRSSNKWLIHPRFAPALWLDRLEDHLGWLAKRPDVHVIHIVRCDNLAWLRSKVIASSLRSYVGRPYPEATTATVSRSEAVMRTRAKNWVDLRLASIAKTNPYLRVYYEAFLRNNRGVLEAVLNFLGCNPNLVHDAPRFSRQANRPVSAQLRNYEELVQRLSGRGLLTATFDEDATAYCSKSRDVLQG